MKPIIFTISLLFTLLAYSQQSTAEIQVIAKLIEHDSCDRLCQSTFQVIKTVKGTVSNDTIKVGFYVDKTKNITTEYVLLNLEPYNGKSEVKDYYNFPEHDARLGLQDITTSQIDPNYWEGCETGEGDCKPLTFIRKQKNQPYYIFLPCGGTNTGVTVSNSETKEVLEEIYVIHSECPPVLNITNLPEGKYTLYMIACNLGGPVEIILKDEF